MADTQTNRSNKAPNQDIDIDLNDPEVSAAAKKIQCAFRFKQRSEKKPEAKAVNAAESSA